MPSLLQLPIERFSIFVPVAPLPWLRATVPVSVKLRQPCLLPAPELLPLIVVTPGTPVMTTGAAMVGKPPLMMLTVVTENVIVWGVGTPPTRVLVSALASSMAARRLHLPLMSAQMPSPFVASPKSVLPMLTTKALVAANAGAASKAANDSTHTPARRPTALRSALGNALSGDSVEED